MPEHKSRTFPRNDRQRITRPERIMLDEDASGDKEAELVDRGEKILLIPLPPLPPLLLISPPPPPPPGVFILPVNDCRIGPEKGAGERMLAETAAAAIC